MTTVSLTTCIVMSLLVSKSLSEPSSLSKTVSNLSSKLLLSMDKTTSAVENVIISPVSIFLALSLLYHGSDLSTKGDSSRLNMVKSMMMMMTMMIMMIMMILMILMMMIMMILMMMMMMVIMVPQWW